MSELTYQVGLLRSLDGSTPEQKLAQENAFARLDAEYRPRAVRYCENYLGSAALSDEVAQQVMIGLWLKKDILPNQQVDISNRVGRLMQWRTLDMQGDIAGQVQHTPIDEIGDEHFIPISSASVASTIEGMMDLEEAADALQKIHPNNKQILILSLAGLTVHEMADELGITSDAAKVRLHRARKAFAGLLQDWENEPPKPKTKDAKPVGIIEAEAEDLADDEKAGKQLLVKYYKDDILSGEEGIPKAKQAWQNAWKAGLERGQAAALRVLSGHIITQSAEGESTCLQKLTLQTGYFNNFALEVITTLEEQGLAIRYIPKGADGDIARHIISPTKLLVTEAFNNPGLQKQVGQIYLTNRGR